MRSFVPSLPVLALILSSTVLNGCGGPGAPRSASSHESDDNLSGSGRRHARDSDSGDESPPDEGPVAAVVKALRALDAGELERAYDFLPAIYQADVDRFVRAFAERTDAEVWAALHGCLRKSLQVLRQRKDLMLASLGGTADNPSLAELERLWIPLIDNAETLLNGIADHEALKAFDSREYLRTIGSPVYRRLRSMHTQNERDMIANLARTEVQQLVNVPGGAVLRIRFPGQPESIEVDFVENDGSWLPQPLVREWEGGWRQIRGFVDRLMLERFSQRKEEILAALADFDAQLNQMLKAETAADFTIAAAPLAQQLRDWMSLLTTPPSRPDTVTITITADLSDEQQTLALGDLEALSDDPSRCTYSSVSADGRTLILVRPVLDVTAYSALLREKWPAIAAITPHPELRTITIMLSGPLPGTTKVDP